MDLPKRYSTRFFLAELPPAQVASHDGAELTDSCWMPAADVLAGRQRQAHEIALRHAKDPETRRVFCEHQRIAGVGQGLRRKRRAL